MKPNPNPTTTTTTTKTTVLLLLLSLVAIAPSAGLKISVSVPELVKLNDAFWLNCSHQQHQNRRLFELAGSSGKLQDRDQIYAIKWFKDDDEFYRYLPKANPKVLTYETRGVQIDVSISFVSRPAASS